MGGKMPVWVRHEGEWNGPNMHGAVQGLGHQRHHARLSCNVPIRMERCDEFNTVKHTRTAGRLRVLGEGLDLKNNFKLTLSTCWTSERKTVWRLDP